jgi:hypothetical protein
VRLQDDGIFLPDLAKLEVIAGIPEAERKH